MPFPCDEAQRFEALRRYGLGDAGGEAAFGELAFLARCACVTPIAFISFVGANREVFKGGVGIELREAARDVSGYPYDSPDAGSVLPPGTGFLQKPFTTSGLVRAVSATLDLPG